MKRNLFNELKEGFTALESAREGKITLRQHGVRLGGTLTSLDNALMLTPMGFMNSSSKISPSGIGSSNF